MRARSVVALAVLAALLASEGCASAARVASSDSFAFPIDSVRTESLAPGIVHRSIRMATGPWAIEVLAVTLDRCTTALAVKGVASSEGRERTSVLLTRLADSASVLGGVNADFFSFTPPGVPTGVLVARGRMLSPPSSRPVFAVDSLGVPHILVLQRTADTLVPFHPIEAVGGRPVIVRDGQVSTEATDANAFATTRHPRTAVGITTDGHLLLVVVDGRQPSFSVGMSLAELADLMRGLGAHEALNLDGGGSTTMVARDPASGELRIVNRPSDKAGERPVGDALAVVRRC